MATTPLYALVYPTTSNQITPLATHFANLATSTETAIATSAGRIIDTEAVRGSLVAPRRKTGVEFYATDTKREYKFDGTNWQPNSVGQTAVYPTSLSGQMTLQADGSIGGTNLVAGATNIDGIFTTQFTHYRIVIAQRGKANIDVGGELWARVNGVTQTQGNYFNQLIGRQGNVDTSGTANSQTSYGDVLEGKGSITIATADIFVDNTAMLIVSTNAGRGGTIFTAVRSAGLEGLSSRPTGISYDLKQNVAFCSVRIYAYA